jgi:DNA-binding transcriptional regulator YiaG
MARYRPHPNDVLDVAIAASGLSARSFAALLQVDERTVRRWKAEEREIPGPVIVICAAIIRDPRIVAALAPERP